MNKSYLLIDTKYINISDKYNFRYYLDKSINIKKYLKLSYAYIPRLNYMINDTNNMFGIIFYTDAGPYEIYINLPSQNYTPLSFCNEINE